jgi:hypothetical protein
MDLAAIRSRLAGAEGLKYPETVRVDVPLLAKDGRIPARG